MPSKSSLLPRLGLSRGDGPILPLHGPASPPVRKKTSEYDLSELSPKPDDALLPSDAFSDRSTALFKNQSPSLKARHSDRTIHAADAASRSPPEHGILFAGPPPPIAISQLLYRDEENRDPLLPPSHGLEASSIARNINSVLFSRGPSSPAYSRNTASDYNPDPIWLNLQRREYALQTDLQHLLDAQSAGLAAHLEPNAQPSTSAPGSARSDDGESDSRSATHTDASSTTPTATTTSSAHPRRHVAFDTRSSNTNAAAASSASATGSLVVPVRQPHPGRPPGLRAARAGLARTIALLADLKAEEDARLAAALSTRKQALAQLRRLAARREAIAESLRLLELEEDDGDEAASAILAGGRDTLGRELARLERERNTVQGEIAALEERLASLRQRKSWLDRRADEVRNRREAGLSGYRGALREIDSRIAGLLTRPRVQPLPVDERFSGHHLSDKGEPPLGGVEFLRLRPERRTVDMAREWWEAEVGILEKRKVEVDRERAALEEGVSVWKDVVKLVSEFEDGLRRQMREEEKGKQREREPSQALAAPEQAMRDQLDKMRAVIAGLEGRLHVSEEKGWNLLICAIGAELEAFRQAEGMLREALRAAGLNVKGDDGSDGDATPHLGRSASLRNSRHQLDGTELTEGGRLTDSRSASLRNRTYRQHGAVPGVSGKLLELHGTQDKEPESDNEVPRDLLVAAAEEDGAMLSPALSRQDSENEVPPEFLRELPQDDEPQDRGVGS